MKKKFDEIENNGSGILCQTLVGCFALFPWISADSGYNGNMVAYFPERSDLKGYFSKYFGKIVLVVVVILINYLIQNIIIVMILLITNTTSRIKRIYVA